MTEKSGCIFGWLANLLNQAGDEPNREGNGPLPYKKCEYFFSKAERSFYGVLQQSLSSEHLLFAKVRLCDVVEVTSGMDKRQWQIHWNRISSKHVDFLICDSSYVKPVLVIELDDNSHSRTDRRQRDELVDRILAAAKIPILRVPAKVAYLPKELHDSIRAAIQG